MSRFRSPAAVAMILAALWVSLEATPALAVPCIPAANVAVGAPCAG